MGFWTLFEVASMPMLQVIIITMVGAFMATDYLNLLSKDTRRSLNKIVFTTFAPSIILASLAETVTLEDIISWWFMPVNIGLTFLLGGVIGWMVVKILKPKPHLEGLVIAMCSAGNLGNMLLILVPAICKENGSPFGDHVVCASVGLSYTAFSLSIGAFYIWTFAYQIIRSSALKYEALKVAEEAPKAPNENLDANGRTHLLEQNQKIVPQLSTSKLEKGNKSFWNKINGFLHQILHVVLEPPIIAVVVGFFFGAIPWLNNLIIGETAPLRVIQDCCKLLGNGTIPCMTLILGGNLVGIGKAKLKPSIIITIICVRYILLPVIGIGVVKAATKLGFLPPDPLYHFMLLLQFTLPPAMAIGTISQLFEVGQDECSILTLWTYLVASLALTVWSTVYMWILS